MAAIVIIALVGLLLLVCWGSYVKESGYEETIERLEGRNATLRHEREDLAGQVELLKKGLHDAALEVEKAREEARFERSLRLESDLKAIEEIQAAFRGGAGRFLEEVRGLAALAGYELCEKVLEKGS
jgi:ABC-type transport system involved in cytochrome bd biosynthesis fused ATPase/permease subunit